MTADPAALVAPPARRRRLPRLQRTNQLLDVAEALFVEQGFAVTSIEDIAREAGVSRPIVYEHFGSKEGVYLECVRRARRAFEAATDTAVEGTQDPREQMLAGARVYFELLAENPRRWELLFARTGLVADSLADQLTEERYRTVSALADRYAAYVPGYERALVEAAAHSVSGAAEQLGRWWLRNPDVSLDEVTELHMSLVWPGLTSAMAQAQALEVRATVRRRLTRRP